MRRAHWLLFFSLLAALIVNAEPIPVVLDTDIGDDIDDALALALLLQSPELHLLAVSTVLNDGQRRADLAYKILELYHRTDVPVGVGAQQTLLGAPKNAEIVQGKALGVNEHQPVAERHNGIRLLIDTCLNAPGKVTVIAIGPLTNIAIALRTEPRLYSKIDRLVLMNGYFAKPKTEYNVYTDAEASQIVYTSGIPILAVGLDVTLQCRLNQQQLDRIDRSPLESSKLLMKLIRLWQGGKPDHLPTLHDPLAIGATIRPNLIGTQTGNVTVELKGSPGKTYGMTLFEPNPSAKTQVAAEVASSEFLDFFLDRILAPPR